MMPAIKPRAVVPLLTKGSCVRQRGAALIAAIFVITALAALGGLMSQLLVLGSEETIDEWYSSQALYAAESGVEWALWDLTVNGGSGVTSNSTVVANQAWMTTTVNTVTINGTQKLYTITSTGTAGGTAASPRTQRQVVVQYMP
jgi:Tfp pilus assembly protein PilX